MAEVYSWLFVDLIPLLYERRRVAKQLQMETWLDLAQLLKELKLEMVELNGGVVDGKPKVDYVA